MIGEQQVGRRFRVGLVVLVALVGLMLGIFMVGRRANLFSKKLPYETRFDSAAGLVPGNPVRLNGVTVGNVLEVKLSPDPADRSVQVVYDVDRRLRSRLRSGTRASIKTIGLLGDKYVDLEGGNVAEQEIEVGGEIKAAPGAGIEKLLEGGGDLLSDLSGIARSLKNILSRTEQGKGFLGQLTSESPESAQLSNSLNTTLTSLNGILRRVQDGHGLVGRLLIDNKYGKETGDSLRSAIRSVESVFARIDGQMRTNTGAIPALLGDPDGKKKVYDLVDHLSQAAVSLAAVTHELEKGEGAIPTLLHDPKFGKEFTGNLRRFSEHLDSIGRKLDGNQGTAGKLINDPSIFDAVNRLVVGVDESRLLRWLVRNRQKAGIRKQYDQERAKAGLPPDQSPEESPDEAPPRPSPTPGSPRP